MLNHFKQIKSSLKKILFSIFVKKINYILKKYNYLIIYRYGKAIGEHVCMTGIISKVYKKDLKIIVFSNYPELFINNYKIFVLFDLNKFFNKKVLLKLLNLFEGQNIKSYRNKIDGNSQYSFMKFYPRNIHFGLAVAHHFDINLKDNNFKNEIFFSEKELFKYKKKFDLPIQYAVIHSEAKKTFIKNKDWGREKTQDVVNKLNKINWIQIGKPGEFILKNTLKCYFNISLREVAFIIYNSNFLLSMEGMFNHMASAVDKKSFLIHTGFLTMESIKYSNNTIIEKNSELKCYPCFSLNCTEHSKHCDENLSSDYVIDVIKKNFVNTKSILKNLV
jgi:hypothetical protein